MFPLFETSEALLALILGIVAFAIWSQKLKFFKKIGPALTVVIIGIILANLKIVPAYQDVYGSIVAYCVPVATSLYLLNMDMSQLRSMSKQPWIAVGCAVLCVSIVATVFGLVFADKMDEGWKIAGMFVGTYTGGSSNLTAIAVGLEASQDTIAAANAADYVVGMPTMILMFAAPALMASSKWFQRIWPYHFTEEEYKGGENAQELLAEEKWSIKDIAILLALSFSIVALSTFISGNLFGTSFASAGRILLISTLSLICAQVPAVKRLRGQFNLGLFFSLTFLVIIGFMVDIRGFFGSAFSITLFCLCVIVFSILLHLLLLRLFKIKYEYAVLSITGAIADGTTAALVAAGGGWKNLVGVGLLMGLIGAVCGNYVGIGVAYLIKALIGA
ncbi:DUF819 family protein [Christensenellaceae bacterium OttesenSCG-928-M15]|nr:DUF819 family protein [Christensenellaceae bacterium OttesenSCG-928-M15]